MKLANSIVNKATPALATIEATIARPEFELIARPITQPLMQAQETIKKAYELALPNTSATTIEDLQESSAMHGQDRVGAMSVKLVFYRLACPLFVLGLVRMPAPPSGLDRSTSAP